MKLLKTESRWTQGTVLETRFIPSPAFAVPVLQHGGVHRKPGEQAQKANVEQVPFVFAAYKPDLGFQASR